MVKLKQLFLLVLAVFAFSVQLLAEEAQHKKVLIFYSSIGMGHISASRAIEKSLKEQAPDTEVEMINIRSFMGKYHEKIDEKIFWTLVKNFPDTFDKIFRSGNEKLNKLNSLTMAKTDYDESAVLEKIKDFKPTHIIATHYGSAQVLGNLREKGLLKNIPVAWLHTDYFVGFLPRISDRIHKTFLGMKQLEDSWIDAGIDSRNVVATGLPVNPNINKPVDRNDFLISKHLDPSLLTVTIATGGEAVGDFKEVIKQLSLAFPDQKIQIIAVTAKNKKMYDQLLQFKTESHVSLYPQQMLPNDELLGYIKSSDLYITKSGGMSPTEAFVINKPTILLDIYGGHERENANLFEKENLALIAHQEKEVGALAAKLVNSPELTSEMLKNQLAFKNSLNFAQINKFVFDEQHHDYELNLGVVDGDTVSKTAESLEKLNRDVPTDFEIILSYGKSDTGSYVKGDTNPFGHIAIRIRDQVFSINADAVVGVEKNFANVTTLEDYLYGVHPPTKNVLHTDSFGVAYARDNISLRVQGLAPEQLDRMLLEIEKIDDLWQNGEIKYQRAKFNCADHVLRVLRAAGMSPEKLGISFAEKTKKLKYTFPVMPMDVFEAYREYFEQDSRLNTELVMYGKVPNSKSKYKDLRFPVSVYQLKRSLMNILRPDRQDIVETMVTKRISVSPIKGEARYENLEKMSMSNSTMSSSKLSPGAPSIQSSSRTMQITCSSLLQSAG